jgi:DNA processing protein
MSAPPNLPYYLAFNMVNGIGPARLARLVERCGSIEAAWNATPHTLMQAGLDARSSAALLAARRTLDLDAEQARAERLGVRLLCIEDPDYPTLLSHAPSAPPLLYVRGALLPNDDWSLAVVGTRAPSPYGREAARKLAGDLARAGLTIISGLALGVDTVAHEAALEAGGRTLAVLACGVDLAYPERNARLAERICQNGALISDYPIGTRPVAGNFPPRNRIISGMARGVLVVEAGEHSGALITVDYALEQGRDVFAIPGSIFARTSAGTNRLIARGAGLVAEAQDVLDALNLGAVSVQQEVAATVPADPAEAALLEHLSGEPRHVDEIGRASGLGASAVLATLSLMELKGSVRQVGVMHYVLAKM